MPPFLPVVGLSRSQNVRLGRGASSVYVSEINMGTAVTSPQSGALNTVAYADLGDPYVRRDVQRHSTLGAIMDVGSTSPTVWSDLYRSSSTGAVASAGSTFTCSISPQTTSLAAPLISSRFYGVPASLPLTQPDGTALGAGSNLAQLTLAAPHATLDRYDLLYVTPRGRLGLLTGKTASAAAVSHVFTMTKTGTPAAGAFKIGFTYNGYNYVSASIAFGATGSAVCTGLIAATGGPAIPAAGFTGSATTLPATTTITAASFVPGPITNLTLVENSMTASTTYVLATTVVGSGGATLPPIGGNNLPLALVYVPGGAANAAGCTFTNVLLTS